MYVCMYVCLYVCLYVCMYVCKILYLHVTVTSRWYEHLKKKTRSGKKPTEFFFALCGSLHSKFLYWPQAEFGLDQNPGR